MIISGGLNVYPKEIEDVIHAHPGVREASVVGVPDERWGEKVVAVVVAEDGEIEEEELITHCRAMLAHYKCPRTVMFRAEPLPRSSNSKILKRVVREWAEAEAAAADADSRVAG
jgi:acyl-CoA synthetase (AMP-forming)/AMP-acid ligase II